MSGLAAGGCYLAYLAISGRRRAVRITEDGIEDGRRAWPWSDVRSVGGCREGRWVTVRFVAGRDRFATSVLLTTTPRLTLDEFGRLAGTLDRYLSQAYPHVQVDQTPRATD